MSMHCYVLGIANLFLFLLAILLQKDKINFFSFMPRFFCYSLSRPSFLLYIFPW